MAETININIDLNDGGLNNSLESLNKRMVRLRKSMSGVKLGTKEFKNLQTELIKTNKKATDLRKSFDVSNTSISNMKQRVKELSFNIKNIPTGSKQFKTMSNELSRINSKLKTTNEKIRGMSTLETTENIGRLATGIGGVTAAFVMMGGEGNETMEELQSSMNKGLSLMIGIKGATEAWTASMKLAKPAMSALNTAMKANPAGVIAAGVSLLVGAITAYVLISDDAEESVKELTIQEKKLQQLEKIGERRRKNRLSLNKEIFKQYSKQATELILIAKKIEEGTLSIGEKEKAVKLLNDEFSDLQDKQITQTITEENLLKVITKTTKALLDRITYSALTSKIEESISTKLSLTLEQQDVELDFKSITKVINSAKKGLLDEAGNILNEERFKLFLFSPKDTAVDSETAEQQGKRFDATAKIWKGLNDLGFDKDDVVEFLNIHTQRNVAIEEEGVNLERILLLREEYAAKIKGDGGSGGSGGSESTKSLEDEILTLKRLGVEWEKQKEVEEKYTQDVKQGHIDKMSDLDKWVNGNQEAGLMVGDNLTHLSMLYDEFKNLTTDGYLEMIDASMSFTNSMMDISNSRANAEIDSLKRQKEIELNLVGDNENKRLEIEERFANETDAIKRKQFEKNKRLQIANTLVNGASAQIALWADAEPTPVNIAQSIALGALTTAELFAINSTQYAKGGVLQGQSHANGGILTPYGELEGGEGVITNGAMSNPALRSIASAVNQAGGGVAFPGADIGGGSLINYDLLASKINSKKVYVVSSDITNQQSTDTRVTNRSKF